MKRSGEGNLILEMDLGRYMLGRRDTDVYHMYIYMYRILSTMESVFLGLAQY